MDEYAEHVIHFAKCLRFIGENGIGGDILEFGVGGGETLLILERTAGRLLKQKHRILGFDSFQGLPEPKGKDRDVHGDPSNLGVRFAKGTYRHSREAVSGKIKRKALNAGNVQLVEGWYEEVLTPQLAEQLSIERASLINVDCDFYESAITVLHWCAPLIRQGTVINFDDWYCYESSPEHGEQLAFGEFLAEHPDMTATPFSNYSWHGLAFIMNKRSRNT